MRFVAVCHLSILFLALCFASEVAAASPGAEVYGSKPEFRDVRISPDGKHVAMISTQGDREVVVISEIGGANCRLGGGGNKLRGLFWANNDRVVVQASVTGTYPYYGQRMLNEWLDSFSVATNCADPKKLNASGFLGFTADGQLLMTIVNMNDSTRSEVLTRRKMLNDYKINIQKIDPATGFGSVYEAGKDFTKGWIVDSSGKARIRVDYDQHWEDAEIYARIGTSDDWVLVRDGRTDPGRPMEFLGWGRSPDTAYVVTHNGGDRAAVYEFDLRSKSLGRVIAQNAVVDVDGLAYSAYSQEPVGTSYVDDRAEIDYFERDYAQMQANLRTTYPGEAVYVASVSKDRKRYIAFVDGATNPGGKYYYVDTAAGEISAIGARYPGLSPADIGPVKWITYTTRDGAKIPAYLTLPYGSSGKNLPLVVIPHGGPEARDEGGFEAWSQFLASRGYAVLQPQYRGSVGFGLKHRNAGRQQWGMLVQNDISDGVTNLTSTGVADPKRVAIVGWSFGGYATLAGMAFTPDLYKCGVSGAGVSDLPAMLDFLAKRSGEWLHGSDQVALMIGLPNRDRERLLATSPAQHAANFKGPVLLVHGRDDTVVPKEQSDIMVSALKAAGKPYEYVEIDGEDHWLSRPGTGKRFLAEVDRFLGEHLK